MRLLTVRPGEILPPEPEDHSRRRLQGEVLTVTLERSVLADARRARAEIAYWCRFSNVFGERFETRTTANPSVPATFTRLIRSGLPPPE